MLPFALITCIDSATPYRAFALSWLFIVFMSYFSSCSSRVSSYSCRYTGCSIQSSSWFLFTWSINGYLTSGHRGGHWQSWAPACAHTWRWSNSGLASFLHSSPGQGRHQGHMQLMILWYNFHGLIQVISCAEPYPRLDAVPQRPSGHESEQCHMRLGEGRGINAHS